MWFWFATSLVGLTGCSPSVGVASELPAAKAVGSVDVNELAEARRRGEAKRLIDVRTPQEFQAGHVPGAVNVPLDQLDRQLDRIGGTDAGEVHLICHSGARSARAASALAARGYATVNIEGGTAAWRAAGLPIE